MSRGSTRFAEKLLDSCAFSCTVLLIQWFYKHQPFGCALIYTQHDLVTRRYLCHENLNMINAPRWSAESPARIWNSSLDLFVHTLRNITQTRKIWPNIKKRKKAANFHKIFTYFCFKNLVFPLHHHDTWLAWQPRRRYRQTKSRDRLLPMWKEPSRLFVVSSKENPYKKQLSEPSFPGSDKNAMVEDGGLEPSTSAM